MMANETNEDIDDRPQWEKDRESLLESWMNGNIGDVITRLSTMKRSSILAFAVYCIDQDNAFVEDLESMSRMLDNRDL